MRKLLLILGVALAAVCLGAEAALAWGPGVHLATGNYLLANLQLLAPAVAAIISRHPNAFLYGALSADIFIGKGSEFRPEHSHNWMTGFNLLESPEAQASPRVMAYAYGYLTHLAADTVAHNFYVPNMLLMSPRADKLSHVLIEMDADTKVTWSPTQLQRLFAMQNADNDGSLLSVTGVKRFAFLLKKKIYKNGVTLADRMGIAAPLANLHQAFSRGETDCYLGQMVHLSLNVSADVLRDPDATPALRLDPIGSYPLKLARGYRRSAGPMYQRRSLEKIFETDPRIEALPLVAV